MLRSKHGPIPETVDELIILGETVHHNRTCNCYACQQNLEELAYLNKPLLDLAEQTFLNAKTCRNTSILFRALCEGWTVEHYREVAEKVSANHALHQ